MRRIRDYLRFLSWQAGLSYIALWAVTIWTLDYGPELFGKSGVCQPDQAKVLFYWICEPDSLWSIAAAIANTALTVTVWAPVYIAAATVRPDAIALAIPIVATHVVGLPTAIFVTMRIMLALFQALRRFTSGRSGAKAAPESSAAPPPVPAVSDPLIRRRLKSIPPRSTFGLRGGN